jgi:hypothetical protein
MAHFELDDAEVITETDKAILVEAPDLDDQMWIPKSAITDDSEVWEHSLDGCGPGVLVLKLSWAERKGLV